jgi:hypothetical protein
VPHTTLALKVTLIQDDEGAMLPMTITRRVSVARGKSPSAIAPAIRTPWEWMFQLPRENGAAHIIAQSEARVKESRGMYRASWLGDYLPASRLKGLGHIGLVPSTPMDV